MGLLAWLTGKSRNDDPRVAEWRRKWTHAVETRRSERDVPELQAGLDALELPDDDIEVEREMLDGLRELWRLHGELDSAGLPSIETGHRVIGADVCHFSAPASMPDDEAQPSGRLLLTSARAIFAGGARTRSLPWHAVGKILHSERDILLVRKDQGLYRFRCNTYSDALRGTLIAERLVTQSRADNGGRGGAPSTREPERSR